MRNVYNTKIIGCIEQGSIINHCFARDYQEKNTYGIVITPRCDLANEKVSTIHYLPIISFEDWTYVDFWGLFSQRLENDLKGKIKSILEKYKLTYSLVEMFTKTDLEETLPRLVTKSEDLKLFSNLYDQLQLCKQPIGTVSQQEMQIAFKNHPKLAIAIFKDLKENKYKEYYLIESWSSGHKYFVVLMREIRTLDLEFGQKISTGIHGLQVTENDLKLNAINNVTKESFICTQCTLKSPFIEHLVQHFFLNFGRIGIQDHPFKKEEELFNLATN